MSQKNSAISGRRTTFEFSSDHFFLLAINRENEVFSSQKSCQQILDSFFTDLPYFRCFWNRFRQHSRENCVDEFRAPPRKSTHVLITTLPRMGNSILDLKDWIVKNIWSCSEGEQGYHLSWMVSWRGRNSGVEFEQVNSSSFFNGWVCLFPHIRVPVKVVEATTQTETLKKYDEKICLDSIPHTTLLSLSFPLDRCPWSPSEQAQMILDNSIFAIQGPLQIRTSGAVNVWVLLREVQKLVDTIFARTPPKNTSEKQPKHDKPVKDSGKKLITTFS